MNVDTIFAFFALIGVIALIMFAVYTLMCVIFTIVDHIWERKLDKMAQKEEETEVHDGSMD